MADLDGKAVAVATSIFACVFGAALLLAIPVILLHGLVLSYLWLWFAVPLGVPALNLWHACGVAALLSLFTRRAPEKDKTEKEDVLYNTGMLLGHAFLNPLFTLLCGFIFKSLM